MRLLRASVVAVALVPAFIATARAQDEKKGRPENQVYKDHTQDDAGQWIAEIRFKDVSYRVSDDVEIRKKVSQVAMFLKPNDQVIVYLKEGAIVGIEKGQLKNQLDTLPAALQKAIKETQDDDEVQITTAREWVGRMRRRTDDGIKLQPALPKRTKEGKLTYDTKGDTVVIPYKDIKLYVNLTLQAKQAANGGANVQIQNDAVSRQDLRVGDTVKIGFVYGQIAKLTPEVLTLREWKGNNWGENRDYPRETLGEVRTAALELRRSYPVNTNGEVVVKEEKERVGRVNLLTMRGAVWHDQKEFILVGAQLVFAAGPAGSNIEQTPHFKEEVAIPPVFGDEQWRKERPLDQEDGQVTIYFDPAKNLIAAKSREALPHIVAALASADRDLTALTRVFSAAALNGDPELAVILAVRHGSVPSGPEQEKQQAAILEALVLFGERGAKALIDHVRVPDGTYSLPVPRDDGSIGHTEKKDQAVFWKRLELKLLASIPGAAAGDRGRQLFDLYEERQTELGGDALKVFQARTSEAIDALLDIAVSAGGRPTADEVKRAEDAAQLIKMLGEPAFTELVARVKAAVAQGPVLAKQLEVAKSKGEQLSELIQKAIIVLVDAKRSERRLALNRTLEEAKTKIGAKDWEGGLRIVEDVLARDRDMEEARKLLYECLVHVADKRLMEKKRGEAARLCRRVIDDGQKGRGAEAMLGKMLIDSAREDLDATCVRKEPDQASEVVKNCQKGDVLKIAAVKMTADHWYPVRINDKEYGWISRNLVDPAGDGLQCSVRGSSMRPEFIRSTIELVRKLAPEREADANLIDGELVLRDAEAKYEEGNYHAAYAAYQRARELVPNDERLGNAWKAGILANLMLLLIFGAVIIATVFALVLIMRNRQKRVHVDEFKYYGKDRIRVEREIDGGAAPPNADGAPAPEQPTDAAPPA